MSDLFGNHIVGFPTRRLIYYPERIERFVFERTPPGTQGKWCYIYRKSKQTIASRERASHSDD